MALIQLVAKGFEDALLTGDPQTSHFISRYKRHTPFASSYKEEMFESNTTFGTRSVINVSPTCDMVHHCMIECTMKKTGPTRYPMEEFIREVQVYIGDTLIDTQDSTWFRMYDEMYRSLDERAAYQNMGGMEEDVIGTTKTLYFPLVFWFNRHVSQSLPIIALQQDVRIVFQFAQTVSGVDLTMDPKPRFFVEQIFLSDEERHKVSQRRHVILIEQLQRQVHPLTYSPSSMSVATVPLEFRRPVKAISWVCTSESHGVFSGSGSPLESHEKYGPIAYARFWVGNKEHTPQRQGSWFRTVHPFNRLGRIPSVGIYSLMFARHPGSSTQPSGSLNMSVTTATLQLAMKTTDSDSTILTSTVPETAALTELRVYGQSWNILEIEQGVAGLLWNAT